jgi:hypothetical protein
VARRLLLSLCCALLAAAPTHGAERDRAPGKPAAEKDPRGRAAQERDRDSASTGASSPERRGGTDLGFEAEKEEEELLKKKRTAPLKGR